MRWVSGAAPGKGKRASAPTRHVLLPQKVQDPREAAGGVGSPAEGTVKSAPRSVGSSTLGMVSGRTSAAGTETDPQQVPHHATARYREARL